MMLAKHAQRDAQGELNGLVVGLAVGVLQQLIHGFERHQTFLYGFRWCTVNARHLTVTGQRRVNYRKGT